PITLADESGIVTGRGLPPLLTATAGSLISIPVTVQNSVPAARWASWSSTNQQNTVFVGSRDYRSVQGGVTLLANLRTYLPQDIAAGASQNIDVLLEAPGDPGDYHIRIDLVHQTATNATWFADQGNIPLEVSIRVVAAGDDKTTLVP